MRKFNTLFFALVVSSVINAQAQFEPPEEKSSESAFNLGLGMGIAYGGLGIKPTFVPVPPLAVFAGLGYNFDGFAYNFGIQAKIAPEKRMHPFLTAMYGYNRVIVTPNYSGTYYGPSFGGGLEIRARRNPKNFLNLELLVPVVSSEFTTQYNYLQNSGTTFTNAPLPFTFSFGYHIGF